MNRNDYIKKLRSLLGKLSREDRKRILEFYNELIDDKLEAGLTEEEILLEFGSPEQLARQIFQDNGRPYSPPNTSAKIIKLCAVILGSPIWASLLAAFLLIVFSLFAVLWSVIAAFWCCTFAFSLFGVCGIVSSFI